MVGIGVAPTSGVNLHIENSGSAVIQKLGCDAGFQNDLWSRGIGSSTNYRDLRILANDFVVSTATTDEGTASSERLRISHTTGISTFTGDVTLSGGDLDVAGHITYDTSINSQTTDYTLSNSDNGKIVRLTGSTGRSFSVPSSGITTGWTVQIVNESTATLTIDDNGETINSEGSTHPLLEDQWTGCTIYYDGTDFVAIGKLT
jgi:hypothetical protein